MTNFVMLTNELNRSMHPTNRVYSANSLPSLFTKDEIQWANNDEQYIITLDRNTNKITGHFYDWNEETQDWDDENDVQMTGEQIIAIIKRDHLLMVKR